MYSNTLGIAYSGVCVMYSNTLGIAYSGIRWCTLMHWALHTVVYV